MLRRCPMRIWCAAAALVMLTLFASTTGSVGAQAEGEVGINFVAFACPSLDSDPYSECDILTGATFEVLTDGVPLADSPLTTAPTSLVPGFFFNAPADATLTITKLDFEPVGFAPAAGYAPLVINVADIPIGGCGGESTCPTIEFITIPFGEADAPVGEPRTTAEVAVLPATGSGHVPVNPAQQALPWLSLALGALVSGVALSRRAKPMPNRIDG